MSTSSSSSSLGISEMPRRRASIQHHRRRGSGELEVFEATGYYNAAAFPTGKILREEEEEEDHSRQKWRWERRIDTDASMKSPPPKIPEIQIPQIPKEDEKPLPTSPVGRLASFLNSLFHQAALHKKKKKKTSSSSSKSVKDSTAEDESPSILCSSPICGFRNPPPPPPCSNSTPTRIRDSNTGDLRTKSSHKFQIKSGIHLNPSAHSQIHQTQHERNGEFSWLEEKFKLGGTNNNGVLTEKNPQKKDLRYGFSDKNRNESKKKGFSKFKIWGSNDDDDDDDDDGIESDSSSDLFELENYDLGFYSSGSSLPVYESTRVDTMNRAPTVSSFPV